MSNKILFVFEGEKREAQLTKSMISHFMNDYTIVKCVYGAEIYQLYKLIKEDEDLDTFTLLKNRLKDTELIGDRSEYAEIYLFFDYDGHSSLAEDGKLKRLLRFFNEETDKGKLYMSYPMVEALMHVSENTDFKTAVVPCRKNIHYKKLVHKEAENKFKQLNKYDKKIWIQLIKLHLCKMEFIVNNYFVFPKKLISQKTIFVKQLEKYIKPQEKVAILSAFPPFLHDYYGNEYFKEIKKIQ